MFNQWDKIKPSDLISKETLRALSKQSNLWGFFLTFHVWAVIASAMALYAFWPNALTLIAAIVIIGGRQLGLAILMHEASHSTLFKSTRLNDFVGYWLVGAPIFIHLQDYRKRHMLHHRFTRSERDPENFLYTPFPVTKASMARKIIRDLTGLVFIRLHYGLLRLTWGDKEGRIARLSRVYSRPLIVNGLFVIAFAMMGRLDLVLLLWFLPMATSYQLFLRIRNIAEHATMPDLDDPLRNSRTTLAGPLARATLAPYYVNYHIEHHMLPFIPCYRLKKIHQHMIAQGYGPMMEIQPNYRAVLKLNSIKI